MLTCVTKIISSEAQENNLESMSHASERLVEAGSEGADFLVWASWEEIKPRAIPIVWDQPGVHAEAEAR